MCGLCNIVNQNEPALFTENEVDHFIMCVYSKVITSNNLDVNTYLKIARKLSEGVFKGYGRTLQNSTDWFLLSETDRTMLEALQENVFIFSAAKQYQLVRAIEAKAREMSRALTKADNVLSFNDFKKEATKIFNEYNVNYLNAEYNSAIAQSRSASMWEQIERDKELMPMLTYHTVGDGRVRPEHASMDGITRPVGDKFWDQYFPPNGWNCRCMTLQSDDAPKTDMRGRGAPENVPDIFKFNAGKEKIVFSPEHPYYDIAPRDKPLARNNWGMPLP